MGPTCWMIGLLLGYLLMSKLYKQQGLSDEKFSPLFLYIFLGVLIGGRLGHCIFYQPEYFLTQWDHFIEMLIPVHHMPDGSWKFTGYEGLASHGGVFGMFVGIWLYCRNMKVSGWVVLDNMGICSGITDTFILYTIEDGIFMQELGNFFIGKSFGRKKQKENAPRFLLERFDQVGDYLFSQAVSS